MPTTVGSVALIAIGLPRSKYPVSSSFSDQSGKPPAYILPRETLRKRSKPLSDLGRQRARDLYDGGRALRTVPLETHSLAPLTPFTATAVTRSEPPWEDGPTTKNFRSNSYGDPSWPGRVQARTVISNVEKGRSSVNGSVGRPEDRRLLRGWVSPASAPDQAGVVS